MDFVVTDAEYQAFWPSRETAWSLSHHHKEIFQIGAAKVIAWNVVDRVDIIIKPSINSLLSPESVELTAIIQERIEAEWVSYKEWYKRFKEFSGELEIYTYDNDYNVHLENALLNNLEIDRKEFIKVKEKLYEYWINAQDYSSGSLYKALGLEIDGHVHDAYHDTYSLALSLIELKTRHVTR